MQLKSRILAVDDNSSNLKIIEETLGDGYDLATAVNGEEALKIAPDFRPDVILLDIMMPGIDGYEVCRRIRANPILRHTQIIMVSAKAMVSERLEGYAAGADDYLTKPFEEEELLAKVRVYLRLKSVEELDQLKSNVLSLVGHETRTPLSNIISPAEILATDEQMDFDERKMLAEMVVRNARHLHHFFEKAMTLCAMKSGKVQFHLEDTYLRNVVRCALSEVSTQAAEADVTFEQDIAESIQVPLDREHFQRVIVTLLDNAIRFGPAGSQVAIRGWCQDADVVITITDRGPGIDAGFLPHVFDDFTDADIRHHTEGQGLSLAIARQIVLHHNGLISVQSAKDSGTTFAVQLPKATARADSSELPCTASTVSDPTGRLGDCSPTATTDSPTVA